MAVRSPASRESVDDHAPAPDGLDAEELVQGELFPSSESTPTGTRHARPDPRLTFETFVVGTSNRFAHAACRAVAAQPGEQYNPLYLYSASGLGKTHLAAAIAHEVHRRSPNLDVCFTSSDEFMRDLVASIRRDEVHDFRRRFRALDVLIVEDIESLSSRERTQEEFFHTFNALHGSGRQIVVTADRAPRDIAGLQERLRSRLGWGLIADLQPPDLETRVAILLKKAESSRITLPHDVALLIAEEVATDVRELEATLARIMAHASLQGQDLTADYVRGRMRLGRSRSVSLADITEVVCRRYDVRPEELHSRRRGRHVVLPRQLAMFLCRRHLAASFPRIGELFDRDHTTVIHAVTTIDERMRRDPGFHETVSRLDEELRRGR